jgi:hemolysin III
VYTELVGGNMSDYSEFEEKLNVNSHLLGAILGVIGFILLIIKSFGDYTPISIVSFIIFGLSIITLYCASAFYHNTQDINFRHKRKVLDHCAIYILIAGTYTPFALAALGGNLGWIIFIACWSMAIIGITLKVFFTGRFKIISTLMYVFMGWMIMFFIKPLMLVLSDTGFYWLLAGGIAYTVGALIYSIKSIPLNHAIFHVFVLIGSFCHFISIYLFI